MAKKKDKKEDISGLDGYEMINQSIIERKKPVMVYCIASCPKLKLDRTKYPYQRDILDLDNMSAIYKTIKRRRKKLMQEHKDTSYTIRSIFVDPDTLNKKILEEIKERGW